MISLPETSDLSSHSAVSTCPLPVNSITIILFDISHKILMLTGSVVQWGGLVRSLVKHSLVSLLFDNVLKKKKINITTSTRFLLSNHCSFYSPEWYEYVHTVLQHGLALPHHCSLRLAYTCISLREIWVHPAAPAERHGIRGSCLEPQAIHSRDKHSLYQINNLYTICCW
jgi:hypothetical protein